MGKLSREITPSDVLLILTYLEMGILTALTEREAKYLKNLQRLVHFLAADIMEKRKALGLSTIAETAQTDEYIKSTTKVAEETFKEFKEKNGPIEEELKKTLASLEEETILAASGKPRKDN